MEKTRITCSVSKCQRNLLLSLDLWLLSLLASWVRRNTLSHRRNNHTRRQQQRLVHILHTCTSHPSSSKQSPSITQAVIDSLESLTYKTCSKTRNSQEQEPKRTELASSVLLSSLCALRMTKPETVIKKLHPYICGGDRSEFSKIVRVNSASDSRNITSRPRHKANRSKKRANPPIRFHAYDRLEPLPQLLRNC